MPRHTVVWAAAFSLALTFGFLAVADGASARQVRAAAASACRKFDLQPRPSWLYYGEWANDGRELILADTIAGRLLRYRRSGVELRAIAASHASGTFIRPGSITRTERGLVLFDAPDRYVGLQANLQPAWEIAVRDVRPPRGDRLEIFLAGVGVGSDLFGIAALFDGHTRQKWLGFARLRLGNPPSLERVRTLPSMFTPEGSFYFIHGGPYLANAGGSIYALLFGKKPHIERLLPSARTLVTFPAGYTSPALGMNSRQNTVASSLAWEKSTAPVALFGRGRFLYLLARRPRADGGTQWTLFQIDPERDQMMRSIELPTRASHLVVIPGPREWAIIEKGPVAAVGQDFEQHVGPALSIRSSVIEDPASRADLSACLPLR